MRGTKLGFGVLYCWEAQAILAATWNVTVLAFYTMYSFGRVTERFPTRGFNPQVPAVAKAELGQPGTAWIGTWGARVTGRAHLAVSGTGRLQWGLRTYPVPLAPMTQTSFPGVCFICQVLSQVLPKWYQVSGTQWRPL